MLPPREEPESGSGPSARNRKAGHVKETVSPPFLIHLISFAPKKVCAAKIAKLLRLSLLVRSCSKRDEPAHTFNSGSCVQSRTGVSFSGRKIPHPSNDYVSFEKRASSAIVLPYHKREMQTRIFLVGSFLISDGSALLGF